MHALLLLVAESLVGIAPPPQPYTFESRSEVAEFEYGWSAEVAAVPALVRRFRADMDEQRARIVSGGREFASMRAKMGFAPLGYTHSTTIGTAGRTPQLLSLRISVYEFTGGAHGNGGTRGLLWDRSSNAEIAFAALFAPGGRWQEFLRTDFCNALDAERRKRRGGDGRTGGTIREFDSCPPFSDLAIVPADRESDGRFESIHLIANPYLAGPYSEGDYEIVLPVTKTIVESIRPKFRPSFEVQPQ